MDIVDEHLEIEKVRFSAAERRDENGQVIYLYDLLWSRKQVESFKEAHQKACDWRA